MGLSHCGEPPPYGIRSTTGEWDLCYTSQVVHHAQVSLTVDGGAGLVSRRFLSAREREAVGDDGRAAPVRRDGVGLEWTASSIHLSHQLTLIGIPP
jgi:hypothetical protein